MRTRASAAATAWAAALVTAFALPAGAAQPAMDALRAAIAAPKHVSYIGEMQVLRFGAHASQAEIYRIEHRAPNLTRRWYVAPQALYGDSIISRGEHTYSIDVKHDVVTTTEDDALDDQIAEDDNFAVLAANYSAAFGPVETLDGRPVRDILVTNKYTGQVTMRVKIDTHTNVVLDKEIYAANGSLAAQTRFEHIRYTNDIPPGIFAIPRGMRVIVGPTRAIPSNNVANLVKQAGFAARGPKYLPEGFTPVEGDVSVVRGVRTLQLLYSDGIRSVSLFQNHGNAATGFAKMRARATKIGTHDAKYAEDGPTTLLAWSAGGLHFTLVGDLSREELVKIAASVSS